MTLSQNSVFLLGEITPGIGHQKKEELGEMRCNEEKHLQHLIATIGF